MCANITERFTPSIGRFTAREPVEGDPRADGTAHRPVGSRRAADRAGALGSSRVSSRAQRNAPCEMPLSRPVRGASDPGRADGLPPRTEAPDQEAGCRLPDTPNAGAWSPAQHPLPERETGLVEPHTATDGEITLALDVGRVDLPVTRVAPFARAGTDREDEQVPVWQVSGSELVPDLCPNQFGVHRALCCARVPAEPEENTGIADGGPARTHSLGELCERRGANPHGPRRGARRS